MWALWHFRSVQERTWRLAIGACVVTLILTGAVRADWVAPGEWTRLWYSLTILIWGGVLVFYVHALASISRRRLGDR
jgi:hypothetical protein